MTIHARWVTPAGGAAAGGATPTGRSNIGWRGATSREGRRWQVRGGTANEGGAVPADEGGVVLVDDS
jgi:hypothetical protein